MRKLKLLLLGILVLFRSSNISIGQTPAQVVIDPTSIAELKDMKEAMQELNSSVEFVQGFLEKTESFKRLKKVLEKMTCGTKKMEILIAVDETMKFCDQSLDVDMTMLHLEHVSTKLMIFGQAVAMSKKESIESLDDLIELVEKAIQKVESTNTRLIINQHKLNELAGIKKGVKKSNMSAVNGGI